MQWFEKQVKINGYECDLRDQIKYSALLRQSQQISREHNEGCGFSPELHQKTHTAFLISDLKAATLHPIAPCDTVTVRTRPFAPHRAVFYRRTEFWKEHLLCAWVDTNWVLVDVSDRKILRDYDPALSRLFPTEEGSAERLRMQKLPVSPAGSFFAAYSFIDQNQHLNNAEYADLVCNCTPMDRPLSALSIRYHRECRYGESMSLFAGSEGNLWYVVGKKSENQKCMEANLWFA